MADWGESYTERHHIIPKSCGGTDHNENIVTMPFEYHVYAHYLLYKESKNIDEKRKNATAVHMMMNRPLRRRKELIQSLVNDECMMSIAKEAREHHKKEMSIIMSGEKHPMYGKSLSEDARKKLSEGHKAKGIKPVPMTEKQKEQAIKSRQWYYDSARGKKRDEQIKMKISESKKGHSVSKETREKISKKLKGVKLSAETKKKMSDSRTGRKISYDTKLKIAERQRLSAFLKNGYLHTPYGIFKSIPEASEKTGVKEGTIRMAIKRDMSKTNNNIRYFYTKEIENADQ